jgi:tRNA(Ile)-lysidine synthase
VSSKIKASDFSARELAESLSCLLPPQQDLQLKLALSGGVDSLALLLALTELRPRSQWILGAIHINHGLNPRADDWAEHCYRVCRRLSVPLDVEDVTIVDDGQGLEAAARKARYEALAGHIGPRDVLLTAHQQDDQLETVLLHLLRGTGAHGLAGMAPVRPFSGGLHIRPLLPFGRAALEQYVTATDLRWITDDSNSDTRFNRNYLRHKVLPLLRARWPAADSVIARSAGHAAAASELLDEIAMQDLKACAGSRKKNLSLVRCRQLTRPRLQNLLRFWIVAASVGQASSRHVNEIVNQILYPASTGQALVSWAGGACYRYRDELSLITNDHGLVQDYEIPWHLEESVKIAPLGIEMQWLPATGKGLAASRLRDASVTLRNRRGGEAMRLPGRRHRHKLKKLFQEEGISPRERKRLPLVFVDGELAAVGDRWVAEAFTASDREPGYAVKIREF